MLSRLGCVTSACGQARGSAINITKVSLIFCAFIGSDLTLSIRSPHQFIFSSGDLNNSKDLSEPIEYQPDEL